MCVTSFLWKTKTSVALVASLEVNLSLAVSKEATYFNIITNDGLHRILFSANVLKVELLYCRT